MVLGREDAPHLRDGRDLNTFLTSTRLNLQLRFR